MSLAEAKSDRPVDVVGGNLRIRLAEGAAEIRAAQALRYRVFYESMAAKPTEEMAAARRDFDSFDDYCDHLLVFDEERGSGPDAVVGTYRVMRREGAARRGQFYSKDEYDIDKLTAYPGEILELGRSCVDATYRSGATMQLLWRGIAEYVFYYDISIMFGCASLPGTDPEELRMPLAYLYHHHLAPPALRARALPERYVAMDLLPPEQVNVAEARQALPPLIKGYLRLGGFVGDGAVVDPDFGTTDVCVVVKTEMVTRRYLRHYKREDAGNGNQGAGDPGAGDPDNGSGGGA
ncbi:GNAT family N-acetyltransferase [Pelagibius marinus]|uniref:GNAT family N-acetyltransferase n=1 Tax=Pelagibius marinus TaxID=2762760 RepID=UPI0018723AA0|nr:GNAT family N-acyltransferase [Pelagibius marinus]